MLNDDIKQSIQESVLCWLATVDSDGMPNVSPKEVFAVYDDNTLLIANIASPNSIKNIKCNPLVCISFINVFIQKGYQLKGKASIVPQHCAEFSQLITHFSSSVRSKSPINDMIKIKIQRSKPLLAPSYWLFPDTSEQSQIKQAFIIYGVTKHSE